MDEELLRRYLKKSSSVWKRNSGPKAKESPDGEKRLSGDKTRQNRKREMRSPSFPRSDNDGKTDRHEDKRFKKGPESRQNENESSPECRGKKERAEEGPRSVLGANSKTEPDGGKPEERVACAGGTKTEGGDKVKGSEPGNSRTEETRLGTVGDAEQKCDGGVDETRDDDEDDKDTVIFELNPPEKGEASKPGQKKPRLAKTMNMKKQKMMKLKRRRRLMQTLLAKVRKVVKRLNEPKTEAEGTAVDEDVLAEVSRFVRQLHDSHKIIEKLQRDMPKKPELADHFRSVISTQQENFRREVRKAQETIMRGCGKMLALWKNPKDIISEISRRALLSLDEVEDVLSKCIRLEGACDGERDKRPPDGSRTKDKECEPPAPAENSETQEKNRSGQGGAQPTAEATGSPGRAFPGAGKGLLPTPKYPGSVDGYPKPHPAPVQRLPSTYFFHCPPYGSLGPQNARHNPPRRTRGGFFPHNGSSQPTRPPSIMQYVGQGTPFRQPNVPAGNERSQQPPMPLIPLPNRLFPSAGYFFPRSPTRPSYATNTTAPPHKNSFSSLLPTPCHARSLGYVGGPQRTFPVSFSAPKATRSLPRPVASVTPLLPAVATLPASNTGVDKVQEESVKVEDPRPPGSPGDRPSALEVSREDSKVLDPTVPQRLTMKDQKLQAGSILEIKREIKTEPVEVEEEKKEEEEEEEEEEGKEAGRTGSQSPPQQEQKPRVYMCAENDCKNPGSFICEECRSVIYCSRTCQSDHWEAKHKQECHKLKKLRG